MNKAKTTLFVSFGLRILGFFLCVVPPIICTASYFPIWERREEFISGGVLLLLLVCCLPLYKLIGKLFSSPSSYTVWLILFILFFTLSRIAEQMTVISFVGFVGNALGAICFFAAKRIGGKNERNK